MEAKYFCWLIWKRFAVMKLAPIQQLRRKYSVADSGGTVSMSYASSPVRPVFRMPR